MTCPYSVKTAKTRPADKGKGERSSRPCDKGEPGPGPGLGPGPGPGPGPGLWAPVWSKNKGLVPFAGSATEIIVGTWWFSVGYVTSILVTAVFTSILSSSEHF